MEAANILAVHTGEHEIRGVSVLAPAAAEIALKGTLESPPHIADYSYDYGSEQKKPDDQGWLDAYVVEVSRFGDCVLSTRPEELGKVSPDEKVLEVDVNRSKPLRMVFSRDFKIVDIGKNVAVDILGHILLARNQGNFSQAYGIKLGQQLRVRWAR